MQKLEKLMLKKTTSTKNLVHVHFFPSKDPLTLSLILILTTQIKCTLDHLDQHFGQKSRVCLAVLDYALQV